MPEKFNTTILVAPLDWGLGHATRCIPIIRHLLNLGCTVLIASSGAQYQLLATEFPQLTILDVPNYNISYSKSKRWFSFKILLQVPKVLRAIYIEKTWVSNLLKKNKIDAIISDNRYGFRHKSVRSVIFTHQLQIKTPRLFRRLALLATYNLVNQFSECWVPDFVDVPNLAGKLSHPSTMPKLPVRYLGAISRLSLVDAGSLVYDILIIISGPEPQRSMLETKLLDELAGFYGKVLFVRGLPGNQGQLPAFNNVHIVNHLPAASLNAALQASGYVISRSGYTTVMDLVALKSKAILIPTPGQTEQEYLAKHLHEQRWFCTVSQAEFNLAEAMKIADQFPFMIPDMDMNLYKEELTDFVRSLNQ